MQLTEEQEAEGRRKLSKVYGRGVVHMGKLEEVFGELIAERDRYRVNFTRALGAGRRAWDHARGHRRGADGDPEAAVPRSAGV